ncbi:MAG: creatininase family protein [Hyphomicrobiaceae bacterium]
MTKTVMWKEMTAEELVAKAKADAVVIMPVGSIEQHGPHLPVGVDTYLAEEVSRLAAEAVAGEMPIVVTPTLWCGMAEHHMAFGGTFTLDIPTYHALLGCFMKSLARHGFKRVLIVNGHGGNTAPLAAFLSDFARETKLKVRSTTYFELSSPGMDKILEDQPHVRHACEGETSMLMVVAPGTVKTERLAEAYGPKASTRISPFVARDRCFKEITPSGVVGDARRANADKGRRLLTHCRDAVVAVLRDPALWE